MSVLTHAIGAAKKVKHALKDQIDRRTPVYLSPVRRIERVRTDERVCAMTFDDGPMNLPPNPDNFGGKPLTLTLVETLEAHGGRGTFDVIGDTSGNYPDKAGKHGSATWGGVSYDHYPDINKDAFGGAENCPELIERIISGGHEITNHTYSHVLFGKKMVVYNSRKHLDSFDRVVDDVGRLHSLLLNRYGFKTSFMRPPHYVDAIAGGFSSYDACALLGYQYLAASFDGAGWLPCQTYEQEVEATWKPVEALLKADPDALCGQIIFQKDSCNMARRTPIADGLPKVMEILDKYGYKVVTVSELMEYSPFEDLGRDDPLFAPAKYLLDKGYTIVFKNNKVLPDTSLTLGALLMMIYGREGVNRRVTMMKSHTSPPASNIKANHPYSGAVTVAAEKGAIAISGGRLDIDSPVTVAQFSEIIRKIFGKTADISEPLTHGKAISALTGLEGFEE